MSLPTHLTSLLKWADMMIQYQHDHNITKQCVVNTITLLELASSMPNVRAKARAVICYIPNNDANKEFEPFTKNPSQPFTPAVHMVLEIDSVIIDPTHEYIKFKDVQYLENAKAYMKVLKRVCGNEATIKMASDLVLPDYIEFIKIANEINDCECPVSIIKTQPLFIDYYYAQNAYIDTRMLNQILSTSMKAIPKK